MKRLYQYIFLLFLQSCAFVGQYSSYKSSTNHQNKYTFINIFSEAEYQKVNKNRDTVNTKFIPQGVNLISFEEEDSIIFKVEEFPGGKMLLFGPAYIPVIPNIFYPIAYLSNNKETNYYILMSFLQTNGLCVNNLRFSRNKKEILPKVIEILEFNDTANNVYRDMYTVIDTCKIADLNSVTLPHKYYLFTFRLRKFTTKKIEIRYKGELLFQVKRKKRLYFEPFILGS